MTKPTGFPRGRPRKGDPPRPRLKRRITPPVLPGRDIDPPIPKEIDAPLSPLAHALRHGFQLQSIAPGLIERLKQIAMDPGSSPADAIRAAEVLLDRIIPRLSSIKVVGSGPGPAEAKSRWEERVEKLRDVLAEVRKPGEGRRGDTLGGGGVVEDIRKPGENSPQKPEEKKTLDP